MTVLFIFSFSFLLSRIMVGVGTAGVIFVVAVVAVITGFVRGQGQQNDYSHEKGELTSVFKNNVSFHRMSIQPPSFPEIRVKAGTFNHVSFISVCVLIWVHVCVRFNRVEHK